MCPLAADQLLTASQTITEQVSWLQTKDRHLQTNKSRGLSGRKQRILKYPRNDRETVESSGAGRYIGPRRLSLVLIANAIYDSLLLLYRVFQKELYKVFQMLLYSECYESVNTYGCTSIIYWRCWTMDSLYTFECKRFRNTRHAAKFGIQLRSSFWNTLYFQWKLHWTVTISDKTVSFAILWQFKAQHISSE
jgi:hypothetical protein